MNGMSENSKFLATSGDNIKFTLEDLVETGAMHKIISSVQRWQFFLLLSTIYYNARVYCYILCKRIILSTHCKPVVLMEEANLHVHLGTERTLPLPDLLALHALPRES